MNKNTIPFEITKTDISTGELIPDCTFEILNENNEQVITGTTDENGIAHFQLAIGKYFYREISAPDIYEIDDTPYPFEITENDDIVKAKMTNKKKRALSRSQSLLQAISILRALSSLQQVFPIQTRT